MLMRPEKWKSETSRILTKRNNPLVTDVDLLLDQFHKPSAKPQTKVKYAILVRYYCNEWIAQKESKGSSFRRSAVKKLLNQTTQYLTSSEGKTGMDNRYAGVRQNSQRKGIGIKEDAIEVLQPRPPSPSKVPLTAQIEFTVLSAKNAENKVDAYLKKTGSNLTNPNILEALDALQNLKRDAAANPKVSVKVGRTLEYLNKTERKKYEITFAKGLGTYASAPGAPYTSPHAENWKKGSTTFLYPDVWAMDEMNCLYLRDGNKAIPGSFQHSSFLAGKPVICAGEIYFDKGQLIYITSGSGHYQPQTEDLMDALIALRDVCGVDIDLVKVKDFATKTEWDSALAFLKARGKPMPALPPTPTKL